MKEGVHQQVWGSDMSAAVLSAFYDMDMLYKQDKSTNMNALHINSMLDKKAVGAPVAAPGSGGAFTPGFFRRNSTSNLEALNKYNMSSSYGVKENTSSGTTSLMNKENKFRDRAYSDNGERAALQQKAGSQINSTRYKTELCRPFEENGSCKYGEKCQFAHGYHELRSLSRHPKYKTEPCRTFHTIGFCPYGPRCHFIHNADERRPAPNANVQAGEARSAREMCGYNHRDILPAQCYSQKERPKLHHSLSFSGFSSQHDLETPLLDSPTSRTPPPPPSSFYDSVSCLNSAFSFPGQDLKSLLAVHTSGSYSNNHSAGAHFKSMQSGLCPPSPPAFNMSHLQALRRLSESPVFEPPPSPPDSLSDRDSYASGSLSSSGSLSGSESPSLDAGRRLPIFSRLSISDD
ncbi:mRNA decay activator protein ZFP36L2 isoform X1 [Nerophis ophidion]|uniref:mRNA decay activator protein ZFP36L2 isoform X1 n=1 Tax=Nerophis ophidion TaxID=159077 RepID=UPI002ADFDC75|nr:mRNA decay activator protein ZFP36L2 isoform X1 [Nerophis ophidion]